jgi:PTS system cellobiose-specific IIB component
MKILLVCAAGMSTSLLVSKMKKEAEGQGKNYEIWAVAAGDATDDIRRADVVLLGPQVRFMIDNVRAMAGDRKVPIETIPTMDYGMCNGKNVLVFAEKLVG